MAEPSVAKAVEAPTTQANGEEEELTAQQFLDESDRAMALKQWTEAADGYAQALELLQAEHAEDAPAIAPILHKYGRCLLEHAIVNSGPFGAGGSKEASIPEPKRQQQQQPKASGSSSRASGSGSAPKAVDPRFHFSGDADDDEDEEEDAEEQGGENEEDDEDDFSVAFSVLDFARVIYQKALRGPQASESDDSSSSTTVQADPNATLTTLDGKVWKVNRIKNELAQVFDNLGDVGLESENFQQATSDYESALSLLSPLLHPHSRRLADAYLRLGLALEYHPDPVKQSSTIQYIESATNTLKLRLEAVETRRKTLSEQGEKESSRQAGAIQAKEEKVADENAGDGKSTPSSVLPDEKDDVAEMDAIKLDKEAKDIQEVIAELEAKVQDISANSANRDQGGASSSTSAPTAEATKAALQQAINDAFLGASTNAEASNAFSGGSSSAGPVNDLSSLVRKKKKRDDQEDTSSTKGKGKAVANGSDEQAAADSSTGPDAKKPRVE